MSEPTPEQIKAGVLAAYEFDLETQPYADMVRAIYTAMRALERPSDEATLGVGDGSGQLFVHGSYEAIKRVQAMIFELEKLRQRPSDEAVERVARAMKPSLFGGPNEQVGPVTLSERKRYREMAKRAIAAMQEQSK